MVPLIKVGQVCVVASVVLFAAGYICGKVANDGLPGTLADLITKATEAFDGV